MSIAIILLGFQTSVSKNRPMMEDQKFSSTPTVVYEIMGSSRDIHHIWLVGQGHPSEKD